MGITGSVRCMAFCAAALIISACGSGGGGSGDSDDDLQYSGNRKPASINPNNASKLTFNVMANNGFGATIGSNNLGGKSAQSQAARKLSMTDAALETRRFAKRSLQSVGVETQNSAARFAGRTTIDEVEKCDSGKTIIKGTVEDDSTGVIKLNFDKCRFGQTTLDGELSWKVNAVDKVRSVPTRSVFEFSALRISVPGSDVSVKGSIQTDSSFNTDSERMKLANFIIRDNANGNMSMASPLNLLLRYDDIAAPNHVDLTFQSGRVFDSILGYVDVDSISPLHFANASDSYPSSGAFTLTATGILKVSAVSSSRVRLEIDRDVPADGVFEFGVVVAWKKIDNSQGFDLSDVDTDLDNDGITDTWEADNGLNSLDPTDAELDFDNDGFSNIEEFLNASDPNDSASIPPLENLWQPAPGATPASGNYVYLQSQPGDYIGLGGTYLYTDANAVLTISANSARLGVSVDGDESWISNSFQSPIALTRLEPGYYGSLQRYPFHNPTTGGLSWSGEGRGCNQLEGWFIVDSVTYSGTTLEAIELRFGQYCEGRAPALLGKIRWSATDSTGPPGPVTPPPAGLWQAAAGSVPSSGNYVYLQSQPGDYIGQGGTYLYTDANAILNVGTSGARLTVSVNGDESWTSNSFQGMNSLSQLEPGYYGDLQRYPFHNPVKGGLSWSGEGRGCNQLEGWFIVDSVTYSGTTLEAIELRFEQHCEGGSPALNGEIHWSAGGSTSPPGPVAPPPAGLWQAASGSVPSSGNYVYLQSQPGDYIGQGGTYLYTGVDAVLNVGASGASLTVSVDGDENWSGNIQGMNSLSQLEPGYYGDLQRFPFHNPVKGGLSWSGEGRGCNQLEGWFIVDSVTYSGTTLEAIELRFEQHCEGGSPALNGEIHWSAGGSTSPPGPVTPPPAGLWQAAAGSVPSSGNYVYLQSQPGDYIGQGGTYLYTDADAVLSVSAGSARVTVSVDGDEGWSSNFQGMNSLSQLEPGYYGDLQRYPFHNPVKGGLSWSGEGRGCNTLEGWFIVDSVTYSGTTLEAIELRFEQHCEGGSPALNGKIHWIQ